MAAGAEANVPEARKKPRYFAGLKARTQSTAGGKCTNSRFRESAFQSAAPETDLRSFEGRPRPGFKEAWTPVPDVGYAWKILPV